MKIIRSVHEMQTFSRGERAKGKTIALVPTLGALHEGHLSLLRKARKEADCLVMSLFLNPIQFPDPQDLKRYPKALKRDLQLALRHHVDVAFCPSAREMYPKGFSTYVVEEDLSRVLCAKTRPGHFRGVTTVLAKLFNLVQPHIAFFGQKDAQQALIVQRMVRDLGWDIAIKVLPTVRDADGLAYSSRNALLSRKEREDALSLSEALFMAKVMVRAGERKAGTVMRKMRRLIQSRPSARIDYISVADAQSLEPLRTLKGKILVALAVWFGKTRLIDNLILDV